MTNPNNTEKNKKQISDPSKKGSDLGNKIPNKFKDPETGELRLNALINSYLELERKMADMVDPVADRDRLRRAIGVPQAPDQYELSLDDLPFGAREDLHEKFHELGFTNEQVQLVYNLAGDYLIPMVRELAYDMAADREVERLVNEFGGREPFQETARQILNYGKQHLDDEQLRTLASNYDGVMMLYNQMKAKDGEPGAINQTGDPAGPMGEAELQSLMRDKRYWRDKDPVILKKVTEGFKRLYSG
jgi:hypothetical protein